MANYLRNDTRREKGAITRKSNGSVCFVGYDGELYRLSPGEEVGRVREILHETLARTIARLDK